MTRPTLTRQSSRTTSTTRCSSSRSPVRASAANGLGGEVIGRARASQGTPGTHAPSCCYCFSQALTLSGLALTHFSAAASGVSLSFAMYVATWFWSSFVQVKFFTRLYAGLPDWANFVLTILSRSYGG